MKSKMGKTLLKAVGLKCGYTDPSGRRTLRLPREHLPWIPEVHDKRSR